MACEQVNQTRRADWRWQFIQVGLSQVLLNDLISKSLVGHLQISCKNEVSVIVQLAYIPDHRRGRANQTDSRSPRGVGEFISL